METVVPRRWLLPSYHKLEHQEEEDVGVIADLNIGRPVVGRSNWWFRFRRLQGRMRRRRRRRARRPSSSSSPSMIRLKVWSLLRRRRKAMVKMIGASIRKVINRLKEGEAHLGDLFAGNYLFMQINPTSFNSLHNKSYTSTSTTTTRTPAFLT